MARAKKVLRFLVEFEKPNKADVRERFGCPFCDVKPGESCVRIAAYGRRAEGIPISDLHQQRYGEYLNLEWDRVAYRIKP